MTSILAVWLGAFIAGNWWLLLTGLLERPALRAVYTLSWAGLVLVMVLMTRRGRFLLGPLLAAAGFTLAVLWLVPDHAAYSFGVGAVRLLGLVAALYLMAEAVGRLAFGAGLGNVAGHVIGLFAFLLSRWGPPHYQEAYSQLAMRFGVDATAFTLLACVAAMALALAWASAPTALRR